MSIFTDKAIKYVPRLMQDLAISRVQACGIFGNLGTETGGFKALQEIKPMIPGTRGGYGWMQWTGPRRKKYEKWCKDTGKNPAADETNYEYLVKETLTEEYASLVALRKTTTVEEATSVFMNKNLRPGIPHADDRIVWGKRALDATRPSVVTPIASAGVAAAGATAVAASTPGWDWMTIGAYAGGLFLVVCLVIGLVAAFRK